MSRVAAIDCGTNSFRLLVADIDSDTRSLVPVQRSSAIVRLGEGVDKTGYLSKASLVRAQEALQDFAQIMLENKVQKLRMVATSAARDASNHSDFFNMANQILTTVVSGAQAEIISGAEEAKLSFSGALLSFPEARQEDFLVVDLGGGSTEFIIGSLERINFSTSLNMGSVRISERYLLSDPPGEAEVKAAEDFVYDLLEANLPVNDLPKLTKFVGVAGTFTTLVALTLGLTKYKRKHVHLQSCSLEALQLTCEQILKTSLAERNDINVIPPGRKDIITGGAVIVKQIARLLLEHTQLDSIVISGQDILEGIALSMLDEC